MKINEILGYKGYYLNMVSCKGDSSALKELKLPGSGYRIITSEALRDFPSLECIEIPEGVTSLESEVFADKKMLRYVKLPESLTSIGDNCFKNCESLEEIVLPKGLEYLGESVFQGCASLKKIKLCGIDAIPAKGVSRYAFHDLYDRLRDGSCVIEYPEETTKETIEYSEGMGELKISSEFQETLRALPLPKQLSLYSLYRPTSQDKIDAPYNAPYTALEYYPDILKLIVKDGALVGFVLNSYREDEGRVPVYLLPYTKAPYDLEFYHLFTGDNNGAGYKGDDDGGYYSQNYLALVPAK